MGTLAHINSEPSVSPPPHPPTCPSANSSSAEGQVPPLSAEVEVRSSSRASLSNEWQPLQLSSRHREIMRRIFEGATYLEVAEAMGMSKEAVGLIARSAIFKEELQKLEIEADRGVLKRAEDLSDEALDKLKILMRRARDERVQLTAADSILDRAGYSKIEKRVQVAIDGEKVIRELNRRRREASSANATGYFESGDSSTAGSTERTSTATGQ